MGLLFIQFLPMLIYIVIALVSGGIAALVVSVFKKTDSVNLAVLGMRQTGKTHLFNALRDKWTENPPDQTNIEEIPQFTYTFPDGKKLTFKATKDIGGDDSFMCEYKGLLESSTHIFYFCNVYEYLNDPQKMRDDNSRLDFICDCAKDKEIPIPLENVTLVLSYADKFQDRKSAVADFFKKLPNKDYKKYFQHVIPINMTNKDEVDEFINKAFKH